MQKKIFAFPPNFKKIVRWKVRRTLENSFLTPPDFFDFSVRWIVKGRRMLQTVFQPDFINVKRRTTMIIHHNHTRMTAVPMKLLGR